MGSKVVTNIRAILYRRRMKMCCYLFYLYGLMLYFCNMAAKILSLDGSKPTP
jgi:hypothetical protein